MGTRLPQRLLYTMAVILAVLTMLFLILTMALRISDLLVSSSSSQMKDKSRIEATTVEKNEGGYDCDGSSALYDTDGLIGRIAYVCNGDIYRMDLATGEVARLSHGANARRPVYHLRVACHVRPVLQGCLPATRRVGDHDLPPRESS